MKRIFVLLIVAGLAYWWWQKKDLPAPPPQPSPSPTSAFPTRLLGLVDYEEELKQINVNGQEFRFAWTVVKPDQVEVGINTDLNASSSGLMQSQSCRVLVNGGFYDTKNEPIGLLIQDGEELSAWQTNKLFNGVMSWDQRELKISPIKNSQSWWALQAGPILWRDGQPVLINVTKDQEARRMIAGITEENELLVAVVLGQDSLFGGPRLAEMPEVVRQIQQTIGVRLESALNLDGGTASAYLTSRIKLKELKPVGSFLCIR